MAVVVTVTLPDWVVARLQVEDPDKVVKDWLAFTVQFALGEQGANRVPEGA